MPMVECLEMCLNYKHHFYSVQMHISIVHELGVRATVRTPLEAKGVNHISNVGGGGHY